MTQNTSIVSDLSIAIGEVPSIIDGKYSDACARAANFLGGMPVASQNGSNSVTKKLQTNSKIIKIDDNEELRNIAFESRNIVFDVMNMYTAIAPRLKLTQNPFSEIVYLNTSQQIVTDDAANRIVGNLKTFVSLVGDLKSLPPENIPAQLSSIRMSFEGYGGSGDAAVDLLHFLPDADEIADQKSQDAQGIADFEMRVPKVIMTLAYAPAGDQLGSIIVWKKIPDASGYIIKRKNLFDDVVSMFTLTNEQAETTYGQIFDYVNKWGLTFYDTIGSDSVFAYLDTSISQDAYYSYTIQAYQTNTMVNGSIFGVEAINVNLSTSQRLSIRDQLISLDPDKKSPDTVSPYPILAHELLGDRNLDWILAGVNIRNSILRSDNRDVTRNFSYLSCNLDFIFDQMTAGKFFVPKDVNDVFSWITKFISKFGSTQTLREIFQEIGILYTFEGEDAQENRYFDRVGTVSVGNSRIMSAVAGSTDLETETLDLHSLAMNVTAVLGTSVPKSNTRPLVQETAAEIVMFDGFNPGPVQNTEYTFVDVVLNQVGFNVADLATVKGIGDTIHVIKIFYDLGPNRVPYVIPPQPAQIPDPVVIPPPDIPVPSPPGPQLQPPVNILSSRIENSGGRVHLLVFDVQGNLVSDTLIG